MKKITFFLLFNIILFSSCNKSNSDDYGIWEGNYNSETSEQYNDYEDNPFINVADEPVSTFSIDADGGAYSNVRRFINNAEKPPLGAVRIEEFLNYFPFDYEYVPSGHPLNLNGEIAECPWTTDHKLIRIGIKGEPLPNPRPASTFVFLIDVSGSMGASNKLGLLKTSFKMLVNQLDENDHVAIVTYSGKAGVELPATTADQKSLIFSVIDNLQAGGGTAGGDAITKAYEIAQQYYNTGGNNRIILGTDGDFNVGISSQEELIKLIEGKRDNGIFLTVCGVGTGNYQEGKMEQLANHGDGTYEYIDSEEQATKIFVNEFSKFFTVARDVKVQIEFNADMVEKYRLIGYENRVLNNEDFENDSADAGELGAGQTITALYEIKPVAGSNTKNQEVFKIDFRYKNPEESASKELSLNVYDNNLSFINSSEHMRFSASVAAFGMLLRDSPYKGDVTYGDTRSWLLNASVYDPYGYRNEFYDIIGKAANL